jgi:hypothetical protein
MTLTAHIAGIPVEETLLAFAPLGVAGVGTMLAAAVHRMRRTPRSRRAGRAGP